ERSRRDARALGTQELETTACSRIKRATDADRRSRWTFLFGKPNRFGKAKQQPPPPAESAVERERHILAEWSTKAETTDNRLEAACFHALARIATAISAHRGRLPASKDLLTELAVTLVCNDYGSELIGEAIDPLIQEAVAREG